MVSHSRTTLRTGHVRSLNQPIAVHVVAHNEIPVSITVRQTVHRVERIQDTWIIEDEWWREPISRRYFTLFLDSGACQTIFHDRATDRWYLQTYG